MAKIIKVECPLCHGQLWIDLQSETVIDHKKTEKKNFSSFEDLLKKEKEKKEKADEKFELARELEQTKKKRAEALFEKNINKNGEE